MKMILEQLCFLYDSQWTWCCTNIRVLDFWQTLSHSPKSKSKSRLTTGFSLKLDFPTRHPASHPTGQPGKVSEKQDTAIYSRQKLLVYILRLRNMFWNKTRPKIHPLGVKKGRNLSIKEIFQQAKSLNIYKL